MTLRGRDALKQPDPSPPANESGGLLRLLGLGFGLAGAVGGTIGAGILRTPGLVAAQLGNGPLILLAWLAGGIYALLGALCVAELATSVPRAGGWYVYARRAFGPWAGFTVGWMDWLGHCLGVGWVALTVGDYTAALLPGLGLDLRLLSLAPLLLFSAVQWLGLRAASGSQQLLSLIKALAFLILVAACFLIGTPSGAAAEPISSWSSGGLSWGLMAVALVPALQPVISTYDGWHSPIYFAEEFEAAERDLPRSLLGGVIAVALIYLLVNLALLHVLPLPQLAASNLPVAEAAAVLVGPVGRQLITGLALLSVLGLIHASLMSAPRVLFGLARDGLFSPALARVHAGGTPRAGLLLTAVTCALLVLLGDFQLLLGLSAFFYVALYGSGILAMLWLRLREPQLRRPFLCWGWPLSPAIVLLGSGAFLLGALLTDSVTSLLALLLIALAWPARLLSQLLARLGWQEAEEPPG
ncbi:MAG: APC family permease [Synechococcaceae cyanobacterium]|nr:APC family permease [Synechococcaceae cyanobacterium]